MLDQVSSEMVPLLLVKQVAVDVMKGNPLTRGRHTQVAVVGAFSKTGGRLGGCVLFDTLRRFAALWHKTESSHLKSLGNKRKERQKEQR